MKQIRLKIFSTFSLLTLIIFSCSEETKVELPTSAIIHYSIEDKQVAFTALAHNTDSYLWDFGDGESSTEPNPVHIYTTGGYYNATLTVNGGTGSASDETSLAIAITPYVLLTGGPTDTDGKTWKLSSAHSQLDYFANSDPELTTFPGTPDPLPAGILGNLGLGEVYLDTYTFHFDGSYGHDVKEDNAAFSGLVYQFLTTGGAGIVNDAGKDFGLCTGLYTPEAGATFTYTEKEDLDVPSVYDPSDGLVTYTNVSTLAFTGTEFVGFYDYLSKVIIQDISNNSMRLVMFLAGSPDYAPLSTNALILTFEVVD